MTQEQKDKAVADLQKQVDDAKAALAELEDKLEDAGEVEVE